MTPQEEKEMAMRLRQLRVACTCKSKEIACAVCQQKAQTQGQTFVVPPYSFMFALLTVFSVNTEEKNTDNDPEGYGSELSFLMSKVQLSGTQQNFGGMSYIS